MATRSTPPAATTTRFMSTRRAAAASRPPRRLRWATSPPAPSAPPATKASASACSPTPAAWTSPPTARRWSSPTTTTTRSASSTPPRAPFATSTICVRSSRTTRARNGAAGGTFPFAVVVKGNGTAYVSSDRDREVVVVDVSSPTAGHLIKRIKLDGNALGMTLDASQSTLYVAQDNADQVAVIDTSTNRVTARIDARAPAGMLPGRKYTGAATFAVTLSPDGNTLYAVNSGANSIAVIPLSGRNANTVSGLIPTAYEPHDITFSADGSWMYIINGKSVTGPNPGHLASNTASHHEHHLPGRQRGGRGRRESVEPVPVPAGARVPGQRSGAELRAICDELTERVAKNNFYSDRDRRRRREGDEVPAQAHQARDLRREGEPHLRSDSGRPDQRRERRPDADAVRPVAHAEQSSAWPPTSSRWTIS